LIKTSHQTVIELEIKMHDNYYYYKKKIIISILISSFFLRNLKIISFIYDRKQQEHQPHHKKKPKFYLVQSFGSYLLNACVWTNEVREKKNLSNKQTFQAIIKKKSLKCRTGCVLEPTQDLNYSKNINI
jgi:hypothetical protein